MVVGNVEMVVEAAVEVDADLEVDEDLSTSSAGWFVAADSIVDSTTASESTGRDEQLAAIATPQITMANLAGQAEKTSTELASHKIAIEQFSRFDAR